jgi:GalNAc-alpha-(1->4)-GalNAc-alpha-(1->3)-diNAcBac-PP-undecaprenol alpha-1,4-N-acetyl-D-galactosaminyltransferase
MLTLLEIRKTIIIEQPDIIISFMDRVNIFTLIASIGCKIPVIISERNYYDNLKIKHWKFLRRITFPFTDGMVVLSHYDYEKYNFVKNKQIILNPLDTHSLSPVKISDKEQLLIAVGKLEKQKGFDMLIKALSGVNLTHWKCYIIGEGSERAHLTSLIKEHNLTEKIHLIGTKENVYDYYTRASVFVLSSRFEGYPNVLAEAMAHGCSCIAFDCLTGPSEIISNGTNGYLVEANNIKQLQMRINKIISNPTIRTQFFEAALQVRETNRVETIAQEWENYIKSILATKSIKKAK